MNGYPSNVCVHGNGFVQVSLGGQPETRIHIWHRDLPDCQHVNTATHNHRFGFFSSVLKGSVVQEELSVLRQYSVPTTFTDRVTPWELWTAGPQRLPTGNRPLVKQEGLYTVGVFNTKYVSRSLSYSMEARNFHRTTPQTDVAVTLMTKTAVLKSSEFQASVLCKQGLEPDQEFDRFQLRWPELSAIITDALQCTPFQDVPVLRWETPGQ